ncbi:MAG TPA: YdcH family protein [Pyrinomonadaceae bacterium]|nr:YdcH family protein [Pyrinomonadaceae bacterium]
MDNARMEELKDKLINENPTFRELAQQHQNYEKRLDELSHLAYPSEEEMLEETTIKRKKLAIKDQMYSLMNEYESVH